MFEFLKKKEIPERSFAAVTSGYLMPLEQVKDEAFASKMLGEGVAIRPDGEYVVAPCRGTISMLYPTLHAFGIRSDEGVDILIHIGIDTVKFKGKGFKALKAQNDTVEPGDKIIRFEQDVSVCFQTVTVYPKKAWRCQPEFGVTALWPRITEVDKDPVDLPRGKQFI